MKNRLSKIIFITLVVIMLVIMIIPAAATSIDLPKPTNNFFVNDFAGVIDSEYEQHIQNEAVSLYEKTDAQVVVVTIDSLNGESLEEYANVLFEEWGIGSAKEDNGVLLLVSIGDRLSRIEVGYGLEGALPDGKTGRIQDNYMIPYFEENEYGAGITNGFFAIIQEIYSEYGIEYEPSGYHYTGEYPERQEEDINLGNIILIVIIAIIIIIDLMFFRGRLTRLLLIALSSGRRGGHGSYRGGRGGGGFSGGGGRSGGGGSSRGW